MRYIIVLLVLLSPDLFGQKLSDQEQIKQTLNHYIDAFYKGDTVALKKAIKPRLNKFGYWKNKDTGAYEYYAKMTYDDAMAFVQRMKDEGRSRDESVIRKAEVLDIGNHIASAKVTAAWGIDYMTLSKEDGKWLIEQVIWEGPYENNYKQLPTTYYLIRHAEKDRSDPTNRNPHLTKAGKKRAEKWHRIFKNVDFDMVYSTDYHRTKETATPVASKRDLEILLYNPGDFNLKDFMSKTNGKTVLIVGHSNTTPMLANALLGVKKYGQIADNNNANLYILHLNGNETSSTVLVTE